MTPKKILDTQLNINDKLIKCVSENQSAVGTNQTAILKILDISEKLTNICDKQQKEIDELKGRLDNIDYYMHDL